MTAELKLRDGSMGLLNKLFGNFKLKTNENMKSKENIGPVEELGEAIVKAAFVECGMALKPYVSGQDESPEKEGHYLLVSLEFFYFFVHVVSRYALIILGREGQNKLMKEFIPLVIVWVMEVYSRFIPDKQFLQNLKERLPISISHRDADYAHGGLAAPESGKKSEQVWVVVMLVRNVNIQSGKPPHDNQIMTEVLKVAINQMIALDIKSRIIAIKHMTSE